MAILGYIFSIPKEKIGFTSHVGRDITARMIRHKNGQATDGEGDDLGKPPFPDEAKMTEEDRSYVW